MSPSLMVFAETNVICKQRDWQATTECNQIGDLMVIGRHAVTPTLFRFKVVRVVNDNRLGQIPFEPRSVEPILLWTYAASQDLRLNFGDGSIVDFAASPQCSWTLPYQATIDRLRSVGIECNAMCMPLFIPTRSPSLLESW